MALAGHVDDAQRDAVDVDRLGGLERADDERHEVGAHRHRVGEADGDLAVAVARRARPRARWRRPVSAGSTTSVIAEHRLEVGLVPARERPPAVGGLHLGGGDHVLGAVVVGERAAVEAAQLVVERCR